jgi:hypothetical protein
VPLNDRQTYVNTGTWTTIVFDILTNRRETQRFPFLEVRYPDGEAPDGRLLVWQEPGVDPAAWRTVERAMSGNTETIDKVPESKAERSSV